MTLRVLYKGGDPHGRFAVDPTVTFQAGMVGQLAVDSAGNTVVTLAGSKPLGLIHDDKTAAFTAAVVGEVHTVAVAVGTQWLTVNPQLVADSELVFLLNSSGAVSATLVEGTDYDVVSYANGAFSVKTGGAIALATAYVDADGNGTAESVNIRMNYQYALPGVTGRDTTLGSGLVTLHFQRGEFSVSMYDTALAYAVNNKLMVGDGGSGNAPLGVLTLDARTANTQVVGVVTQPPTASNPNLTLITDFDYGSWS